MHAVAWFLTLFAKQSSHIVGKAGKPGRCLEDKIAVCGAKLRQWSMDTRSCGPPGAPQLCHSWRQSCHPAAAEPGQQPACVAPPLPALPPEVVHRILRHAARQWSLWLEPGGGHLTGTSEPQIVSGCEVNLDLETST